MDKLSDHFNRDTARRFFVRQEDDYSCVTACFATLARLLGDAARDYAFFRNALNPSPEKGVEQEDITRAATTLLPAASLGNYQGGIALAYIVHPPTGVDHAVVFLAQRGQEIVYYDPLDDKVYVDDLRHLKRANDPADPFQNWTANYPAVEGYGFNEWRVLAVRRASGPDKGLPPLQP